MRTNLRIKANNAKKYRCKNVIIILENPKTIENIASTIRNIDALGAEKLYIIDGYNHLPSISSPHTNWEYIRKKTSLVKISVGASKWVFIRKFKNTTECIDYLKKKQFDSIITSPYLKGKNNYLLENGKYTQKRLAIWFGNESQGISEEAIENSKFCVNIQMNGIVESLNLGTTTGIVLYEVTKQRRLYEYNTRKY